MAAELLKAGDILRLADGGAAHVIASRNTGEREAVYNFEVEGFHTYHIGEFGVWVHNTNCIPKLNRFEKKQLRLIERQIRFLEKGDVARGARLKSLQTPLNRQQFDNISKNFVGPKYTVDKNGTLRSESGLRIVRPPVFKKHGPQVHPKNPSIEVNSTNFVSNFQTRFVPDGKYIANLHVGVIY